MPHYIYSTMSNSVDYTEFRIEKDLNTPIRKVTVLGGANVCDKALHTPLGVVTKVTDDEMEFLRKNEVFKMHEKAGHLLVRKSNVHPDVVVPDMKLKDRSAQIVPQDYMNKEGPRPMEGIAQRSFR